MDMSTVRLLILVIMGLLATGDFKKSGSRFTNLKCESYDLRFAKFQNCRLNVIGRGVVAANIHINLFQVPIRNVSSNWSMWRRYNGYQPFLFNTTLNFCKLIKQSTQLSFEGLVFDVIASYSNIERHCPITHDIIVDNLVFNDTFLKTLPLPQGDYKIQLRFATKNIWKFQIDLFLLRDE